MGKKGPIFSPLSAGNTLTNPFGYNSFFDMYYFRGENRN